MNEKSFKLCLTMAGAVSAGGYTAGVIDELLHVLDLWEQQRQRNLKLGKEHPEYDHSLPMHRVTLEVFSGASAGGINAALSLQKMLNTRYDHLDQDTLLKDCWVTMADDMDRNTLEKLLDSTDLEDGTTPGSLLNVAPIDTLADKYFKPIETPVIPAWLSENAELILTTTNLEGIDINIHFDQADQKGSGHRITQHSSVFRYKLHQNNSGIQPSDPVNKKAYYMLDPSSERDIELLKNSALSTSAFPIGLSARKVTLPHQPYLKYGTEKQEGGTLYFEVDESSAHPEFHSIDGGLLNNEPYGWGVKVLEEKCTVAFRQNKFAVIMIDPLPGKTPEPADTATPGIFKVAGAMLRALRNEVMLNQEGLARAIAMKDRTRFLIAPSKGNKPKHQPDPNKNVLASAPISGFAGFIDKERRLHDYELGRRNCRDFIRFHLTLPLEMVPERLDYTPDQDIIERFAINQDKSNILNEHSHLPVIPDVRLLKARYNTTLEKYLESDAYPEQPEFDLAAFQDKFNVLINARLNALVKAITKKWWMVLGFKLFLRRKIRNRIYAFISKELATTNGNTPYERASRNQEKEGVL